MNRTRTLAVALLWALIVFSAGLWVGGHPQLLPDGLRPAFVDEERALRAEVIETIERDFYRPVDRRELERASLKGAVRALGDRFSHYFTPEENRRFQQVVLNNQYEGVGMTVDDDPRGLLVLGVIEGSPADRADIRPRDIITRVDGRSIAGEPSDAATARIKGKPGTAVRLSVLTPATERRRTVQVNRARIEVPVARGRMLSRRGERLGVARLASFTTGAHGALAKEVGKLRRGGARGMVLDLRGNGGGLLQEAVLVSSLFVEDGLIVSTRGRARAERRFAAEGKAIAPGMPLVLLVDGGSASASEIVTGALRDRGRAEVVGVRTFGKGVFQEVQALSNGGALDLTVGSYLLPGGEDIANRGITPRVRARDLPHTERDEALPVALETLAREVRRSSRGPAPAPPEGRPRPTSPGRP